MIRFAQGTTGTRREYYKAFNIKDVKIPSYHRLYENVSKLQKNIFDQENFSLNIFLQLYLKLAF